MVSVLSFVIEDSVLPLFENVYVPPYPDFFSPVNKVPKEV